MAFGNEPKDAGGIPISSIYVPGVGFIALQGSSNSNTDASGNVSTPVNVNIAQVSGVGQSLDNTSTPRVSVYGTGNGTAGDTSLALDGAGRTLVSLAKINNITPTLDNTSVLAVSMRGKGSGTSGDTALLLDSSGRLQNNLAQLAGVAPQMDGGSNNRLGVSLYGKNSAAGDTALFLDSSGRIVVQQLIAYYVTQGQTFSASTGVLSPAAGTLGFSVFNPSSTGKNVFIYSLKIGYTNANMVSDLRLVTTDPAFGSNCSITNNKFGGAATAGVTSTYSTTTQTAGGTVLDAPLSGQNNPTDIFAGVGGYLLPSGSNYGIALYLGNTAAGKLSVMARWIEF